jgi:hypothetical protein
MEGTETSRTWGGAEEKLSGDKELFAYFDNADFTNWLFRGQYAAWDLKTTIERTCEHTGLRATDREKVERGIIRQLRRAYDGQDLGRVEKDQLYAMSLLQHYGAPTRLLDFTYSKYVGIYFALEGANDHRLLNGRKACAVWCINGRWLEDSAIKTAPEVGSLIKARSSDENRTDGTFVPLYMENRHSFVGRENPLGLHHRLHIQQGVFLCPGNVTTAFIDNLRRHEGWEKKQNILKVTCRLDTKGLQQALERCRQMNISRESLFPGLEGFAESMKYQLVHYRNLESDRRTGE